MWSVLILHKNRNTQTGHEMGHDSGQILSLTHISDYFFWNALPHDGCYCSLQPVKYKNKYLKLLNTLHYVLCCITVWLCWQLNGRANKMKKGKKLDPLSLYYSIVVMIWGFLQPGRLLKSIMTIKIQNPKLWPELNICAIAKVQRKFIVQF